MSASSDNSTTLPTSDDSIDLLLTNAVELSRLVTFPGMPRILSNAFENSPAHIAALREYAFVSQGIGYHQLELRRHREERASLFAGMMACRDFQHILSPVLTAYRQQNQTNSSSFEPSNSSFPTNTPRLSPPQTASPPGNDNTSITSSDSHQTIDILSEQDETDSQQETTEGSYHTVANDELGTRYNPINVDTLPEM